MLSKYLDVAVKTTVKHYYLHITLTKSEAQKNHFVLGQEGHINGLGHLGCRDLLVHGCWEL